MTFWFKERDFMKNKYVKIVFSLAEYIVTILIFNAFTVALHEWMHLEVAYFFGGEGYIVKTVYGGVTKFTIMPTYPTITALAGGWGVAGLYLLLMSLDWLDDIEQAAAMIPLITSQFAYGLVEGILVFAISFEEFFNIAQIALAIGWFVGFFISVIYVVNHLWGPLWGNKKSTSE